MDSNVKKRPTIGMLVGRMDESYQEHVWMSAHDYAVKQGANFILFTARSRYSEFGLAINYNPVFDLISKKNIDGLIIMAGAISGLNNYQELENFCTQFNNIPLVTIAVKVGNIPGILVDNKKGMYDAVCHLIREHGNTNIGFINGPWENQEARERFEAYQSALLDNNIEIDKSLIVPGNFHEEDGINAVKFLLDKRKVDIDALVAVDDVSALGALKELQGRGIMVPDDVALVGFDNLKEGTFSTPPLTTVDQPLDEQGKQAVDLLLSLINGNDCPDDIILPTKFLARESCGCRPKIVSEIYIDDDSNGSFNAGSFAEDNYRQVIEAAKTGFNKDLAQNEIVIGWIKEILDILMQVIENKKDMDSFLDCINSILMKTVIKGIGIVCWKNALIAMQNEIQQYITEYKVLYKLEYLFRESGFLIDRVIYRENKKKKIKAEKIVMDLHEISQNLITAFEIDKLKKQIITELPKIGISGYYIVLFEKSGTKYDPVLTRLPPRSELFVIYRDNRLIVLPERCLFESGTLLPEEYSNTDAQRSYLILPLYFVNEQFGYIICHYGPKENMIYETLRSQISSSLKGAYLFNERREAEKKLKVALLNLESLNKALHNQSIKDELTHLYNRRGFISYANEYFSKARVTNSQFVLFFADLDGLKRINDTYGHQEGDAAIRDTAHLLRMSLRQTDLIGRIGGDEFVFIALHAAEDHVSIISDHINSNFAKHNAASDKPYDLSISLGATFYDGEADITFDELMTLADKKLYHHKKKRRGRGA